MPKLALGLSSVPSGKKSIVFGFLVASIAKAPLLTTSSERQTVDLSPLMVRKNEWAPSRGSGMPSRTIETGAQSLCNFSRSFLLASSSAATRATAAKNAITLLMASLLSRREGDTDDLFVVAGEN